MGNALDRIEQFNKEAVTKLNANICGNQKFSLLHTAIVFERPDLVTKLLSLGADPNFKSDLGSPVAFAMSVAERQREKLKLDEEKCSLDESNKLKWEEKIHCLKNIAQELVMHSNFQSQSGAQGNPFLARK